MINFLKKRLVLVEVEMDLCLHHLRAAGKWGRLG